MSEAYGTLDSNAPLRSWVLELSAAEELQRFLVASLAMSGASAETWSRYFHRACRWYAMLLGQGCERAPFFLVHDIGCLLLEGRRFRFRLLSEPRASDRDAGVAHRRQVAYENRVLNRILSLPWFEEVVDVIQETGQRDEIIAAVLEQLLEPLRDANLPMVSTPSHLVQQVGLPGIRTPSQARDEVEALLTGSDWSRSNGGAGFFSEMVGITCDTYQNVSIRELLGPEDVFVIRHFDTLGSRAQRLVARQISEFEEVLGVAPAPPANFRREAPQVAVDLDDSGYFPQGGLDALANRGSVENLVRSELVYMDTDQHPDLFTVRFAENELLYYTRDQGQLLRRSRSIHIVLDLSAAHHLRYPGHRARVSSMLVALVNRLTTDLFERFDTDAVTVHIHVMGEGAAQALRLWQIRFEHSISRGEVVVTTGDEPLDLETVPSPLLIPGRLTSVIYIGAEPAPDEALQTQHRRAGLTILWVQTAAEAGAASPTDDPESWSFVWRFVSRESVQALSDLKTAMVWRLFSG